MASEGPFVSDILNFFGKNWVFEEDEYRRRPQFRYLLNDVPPITGSKGKFEKQFEGYTYDLFRVGGVGFVIYIVKKRKVLVI